MRQDINRRAASHQILLTATSSGHTQTTGTYYVDPMTYQPLRIVLAPTNRFGSVPGFPISALALIQSETIFPVNGQYRFDFHDYRYLPATAAARRTANIQAVHPHTPIL
jgi:hypothetical protein